MVMLRQFSFALVCLTLGLVAFRVPAQAPSILAHPIDRETYIGGSFLMSVTATGAPPLAYRWVKDGTPVARGTNRLLNVINLSLADVGGYQAVVSNAFGVATSRVASLTLTGAPPVIYQSPGDVVACAATSARLAVGASGSPPLAYHWYRDGSLLVNETSWTLYAPLSALGDYFVTVSNAFGVSTSRVARVTDGPRILVQPESRTVDAGSEVVFTTMAQGCPEVRFQWRWNGLTVTNGTNSTLRYNYPTKDYEGDIDVVVSDNSGSVTSQVARLSISIAPPEIVSEPESIIAAQGAIVSFHVGAVGAPPPVYQWMRSGYSLPNQTNAFLRRTLNHESQGQYSVVVSNSYGSVTSLVVLLSLPPAPPVIGEYGQPEDFLLCLDGFQTNNPAFSVSLEYPVPYASSNSFQWFKDGQAISGAMTEMLVLPRSTESIGSYVVVITNSLGSVTSRVASVQAGPVVIGQPIVMRSGAVDEFAIISAEVRTCVPISYQWQRNGTNIPGAVWTHLGVGPLSTSDSGNYRLVVRWDTGSITSEVTRLEVAPREPSISHIEPGDREVFAGDWVQFFASDYDPGAPEGTFQWLHNGRTIPGATNSYLEFIADAFGQQGRYALVISNEVGTVTSPEVTLKIFLYAPIIFDGPEDASVPSGEYVDLSVYAEASPPPSYQWLFNDVPIRGETNDYLNLLIVGTNDVTGYSVIVSNQIGWVTSRVATVHVEVFPPGFVRPLEDFNASAGQTVFFAAGVTSAPPANYQWYFEGAPMVGETGETLQFVAGYARQIGGYSVVASNPLGSVTSRVARLEIALAPPGITVNPVSQSLVEGELLWLRVMANVPVEVQWQRDGIDIDGATNSVFRLRTTGPGDSGEYQAVVWNDQGTATSDVAEVTVRVAGALDRWIWRSPLPQGNDLADVAYGNGRFVAVGSRGGTVVSTNGVDWADAHRAGDAGNRSALAFGNGVFVASEDGALSVSSNGVDWQAINVGLGIDLYAYQVAFGNGRFVVRLNDASVMISTNGLAWERVRVSELDYGSGEIFFVNGRFVVPLYQGFLDNLDYGFAWSVDGVDWVNQSFMALDFIELLACGNDLCVGFSRYSADWLLLSSNGVDWVEHYLETPATMAPRSLVFGNGLFVVAGYPGSDRSGLAVSSNGLDWTPIPDIGTNEFERVRFEDGRFIAVGNRGVLATSTNGLDWQAVSWGSQLNLRGLARANGLFVAVGNGGSVLTSPDGRTWTARESGVTNNFRSVTWFRDRFVVVGESGDQGVTSVALTSADGVTWHTNQAPGDLFSMAHDGRLLVAVGDRGTIVTSFVGVSWNQLPSFVDPQTGEGSPTTQDLNAITWTGTRFVAVGKDGVVISSTNGLHWTSSGPGGRKNLHGIAYGNGTYVTVGNDGRYYVSADASIWMAGNWATRDLSDVVFAGGRFVAVGDSGVMFTSEDGTNWIRRVTGCGNDLRNVIYSEGSYYAVGNNETILQSDQADAVLRIVPLPAAGSVRVEVLGEVGRSYRLQGSTNLTTWTELLGFTADAEATRFQDGVNEGSRWRFYRVVSP